jgi:hypothetical protein
LAILINSSLTPEGQSFLVNNKTIANLALLIKNAKIKAPQDILIQRAMNLVSKLCRTEEGIDQAI